jgi:uncharacterized protein GlcG (DUF336 family)
MRHPDKSAAQSVSHPVSLEPLEHRQMLSSSQPLRKPEEFLSERLSAADVRTILAAAASQALPTQVIYVVDRDGVILGSLQMADAPDSGTVAGRFRRDNLEAKAITRARTAAFFESTQDAFTTRTARFIIQDHFPNPVQNTPGGPLYGVEFSSLKYSDVLPQQSKGLPKRAALPMNVSGDPGGIPLYKNGIPVGGIGVAGDGHDVAVREDLVKALAPLGDNPKGEFYQSREEKDKDEATALAGATSYMAPERIRATQIFLAGLRFPFTADKPASGNPALSFQQVIDRGVAAVINAPKASPDPIYPTAVFGGVTGQLKNMATATDPTDPYGFADSNKKGRHLTKSDVGTIITQAVKEALTLRAAIREPQGQSVRVHIAVTDTRGDVLGVFRMGDGTNFSFDVAVQKARTAAFFSDDTHALTPTAIGFLSQGGGFPPGIQDTGPGPLYLIQNELSLNANNFTGGLTNGPLRNGLTIFPGGVPLYKGGTLVGAVGISGDGVEQDSKVDFFGAKGYQAPKDIRVDHLPENELISHLNLKLDDLFREDGETDGYFFSTRRRNFARARLMEGLDGTRIPFLKFSRNMEL